MRGPTRCIDDATQILKFAFCSLLWPWYHIQGSRMLWKHPCTLGLNSFGGRLHFGENRLELRRAWKEKKKPLNMIEVFGEKNKRNVKILWHFIQSNSSSTYIHSLIFLSCTTLFIYLSLNSSCITSISCWNLN